MSLGKKTNIYELVLVGDADRPGLPEIMRGVLVNAGLQEKDVIESRIDGRISVSSYFNGKRNAQKIEEKIRAGRLNKVAGRLRRLGSRDWQNKWKEDFRPFRLTRRIDVVPTAYRHSYRPKGRKKIYIDTVLAFGTGLHETTSFMAKLIEETAGKFKNFLDVGTGSGILSLVAPFNGAEAVWAIDIDKSCVEVAQENFKANAYSSAQLKVADVGVWKTNQQFDFVAANLISDDLIRLKKKIFSLVKPGQYLALSGISLENRSEERRVGK